MNKVTKTYPTIGVCGLDCGLCPRYYTVGPSRCPGCCGSDFFNKHPSCSFITCCVKKKHLEVCAECSEFPCSKFKTDEEYQQLELSSSFPPDRKIMSNLNFIKEHGLKKFLDQQEKRIRILETMLENFNDGRSKSFFCKAAALLDLPSLENSLGDVTRKIKANNIKSNDVRTQAKILKSILNEVALKEGVELTKKRK
ncbi:MAG: DUF3795 domain-containing protein [Candidatus Heimdallarchaeota archaeon]|nr:MAG: DUF3795 domain-containing protein [Candidatus Heimdallarchaeota archaeon]